MSLMKIGKEYVLAIIGGLFLLTYVLQSGIDPLTIKPSSPYVFLNQTFFNTYPFTAAIIFIRALGLFLSPLWVFSFFESAHLAKGGSLLVIAGLMQLYALQQTATASKMVTLEWSFSLAAAGLALLLPTALLLLQGMLHSAHEKIAAAPNPFTPDDDDDDD